MPTRCSGPRARAPSRAGERVLVFGDFDADGLTGLAILVLALRCARASTSSRYVPDRTGEGHGLSLRRRRACAARAGAR